MATALTTVQYANQVRQAMRTVGKALGADPQSVNRETRVVIGCLIFVCAVIIRCLVLKGVITNADLNSALSDGLAESWPPEPVSAD